MEDPGGGGGDGGAAGGGGGGGGGGVGATVIGLTCTVGSPVTCLRKFQVSMESGHIFS